MTNNNSKETKFEVINSLNVQETTVIVIIWIVIQVFGNGMLIGIIQYDKFGNDPLKRRVNDRVRFEKSNYSLWKLHFYKTFFSSLQIFVF